MTTANAALSRQPVIPAKAGTHDRVQQWVC